MMSAFCCATLGIVPTVRPADFIGAWLEVLREDNRAVIRAASAATKAADYLLGQGFDQNLVRCRRHGRSPRNFQSRQTDSSAEVGSVSPSMTSK